ncbi:MAG: hypothetical protein WBO70_06575 [Erysipelotrichaceae bacterium]
MKLRSKMILASSILGSAAFVISTIAAKKIVDNEKYTQKIIDEMTSLILESDHVTQRLYERIGELDKSHLVKLLNIINNDQVFLTLSDKYLEEIKALINIGINKD